MNSYEQEPIETEADKYTFEPSTNQSKFSRLIARIANYFERKPKAVLVYMGLILVLSYTINLTIQMFYSKPSEEISYSETKEKITNDLTGSSGPSYSYRNYQIMTRLKDTLEYLMAKGDNLTHEDTLTFLRVVDQFHKIDPTLYETVMSIRKAQQEYPIDAEIPDIDAIQRDQDAKFNEIFSQHRDPTNRK